MNRFLDKEGLRLVWQQITNKFAAKTSIPTKLTQLEGGGNVLLSTEGAGKAWADIISGLTEADIASLVSSIKGLKGVDTAGITDQLTILSKVGYAVPTLADKPTENTLSFTDSEGTYNFKIGSFARVADAKSDVGYTFYMLYDITSENKAVWGGVSTGSAVTYNEKLVINLLSNQSQPDTKLNGARITVTSNGDTIYSGTWSGSQIEVSVEPGTIYTVACGGVAGYTTPDPQSYTAISGNTRSVTMYANTTVLTVSMNTNQSSNSDLSGKTATVAYGSTSVQIASGGTVNIPTGQSVTVTFPAVTGYSTPSQLSFTTSGASMSKSGTYQTELVTVTCTADDGSSVSGQKVTINGTQVTLTSTGVTSMKIPFGTAYSVVAADWTGYTTPSSQSFTANAATRSVSVVWEKIKLGVYIEDTNGKLFTSSEWGSASHATANSVVVLTDVCKVRLALTQASSAMVIGPNGTEAIDQYMTAISDPTKAKADYNGATNTANIIKVISSTSYAAGWCNAFTFPNGLKGCLPSLGQLWTIYQNKTAVEACLSACGATAMTSSYYWSSTFWGVDGSGRCCWGLYWSDGYAGNGYLDNSYYVRAVAAY